jgi:capsular polysaccharide biosynthesis protein
MDKSQIVNINLVEPVQVKANAGVGGKSGLSWLFLAGSIGMVAGVGGASSRDFFDHSLSTDQSVKRNVGLPVLGSIPEQRS